MKFLIVFVLMVGLVGCAVVKEPTESQAVASAVGTDLTVELVKFKALHSGVGDFTFRITNVSGKNIRAIKGHIRAIDRFGVSLGTPRSMDIQTDIKASASIETTEQWNNLEHRLYSLMLKYPDGPMFSWETTRVLYE